MRAFFALIISAVISSPVLAEDRAEETVNVYVTGRSLTEACRSFVLVKRQLNRGTTEQIADAERCYGYVTGVFDLAEELTHLTMINWHAPYCIPKGTNANDLVEVVAKFLDENPAERNHSGADLVEGAWAASFPCPSR
jgi:hypothetical protein